MKKFGLILLCSAIFFPAISCASDESSGRQAHGDFTDIQGKEWVLFEIRRGAETIRLDREALETFGFNGVYTITFEDGRVSGAGAPNRFFGPFTEGESGALSIGLLGHTLMAALFEPDDLREHEYFAYLSGVTRWYLHDGRLELFTSRDGIEAVLVFALN